MGQARTAFDALTDALNAHDVERIAASYAEDAVVESPDGTFKGRAEITGYLSAFLGGVPDLRISLDARGISSGDEVCDEWTMTGTNTGDLQMPDGTVVPATGKSVTIRGCDRGTVAGGKVSSHRIYFDQVEFLGQLGLIDA